ncbi:hypothetical protein OQ519_27630 [Pseudomonas lurida]|uniref:hypothetical protein n=1 Tax=Pseudomonas lurida TaxID=244566 RepID=UPI001782C823|nr:hypothetical protein [Pseudomonas lurida]MBD8666530.1 hypothetical protein [Pseudomonas lurida]UZQ74636.1 hypothetical protein OQ519_27630 [Pseudomonas lurida]
MKKLTIQRLIDYKAYWGVKSRLKSALLKVRGKRYNASSYFNSEMKNLKTLRKTLGETFWLILGVVAFSAFLQITNSYALPFFKEMELAVPEGGDYVTFLSAVGGIGGVFIGLYYAALSSVGSAIYAKVPNNIRDLLTQERSGTVYMRFLSALTLLCITLVSFRVCGLPAIIVAVPVVGLLAGAGVVAFVKLGKSAFNLFDPTALSHHVFEDFNKWVSLARVHGYRWNDAAFQNHAYKQASRSIDTLKLLIEMAATEPHQNGHPLVSLVGNTIEFLAVYEVIKAQIPSDSYWYPEQFKHKDWYATAGYNVKIAHVTGTSLQPDMVRNLNWVEDQLSPYILRCITVNLNQGRHLETMRVLNKVESYIAVLVFTGGVTKAFDLIEHVSGVVIDLATVETDAVYKLSKIERLSLVEAVATMPISMALNLAAYANNHSREILAGKIEGVSWGANESLYMQGLPSHLLPQMEWLQRRMEFERLAEGKHVTPFWYQLELLCFAEAKALAKIMREFPERSKSYFHNVYERLRTKKNPWFYAAAQSREHEFWHKAERTMSSMKKNWLEIQEARVIPGLQWPAIDLSVIDEGLRSNQRALVQNMAAQGIILASAEMPSEYPDYAGQFLHITGESIFAALCANDEKHIKAIFAVYLLGCFSRFEKLKPKAGAIENAEHKLHIASSAIIDLMELSGYSRFLAEFHQNSELWDAVKAAWIVLIKGEQNVSTEYLQAIIKFSRTAYALPHRSELRFDWERKINSMLDEIPREQLVDEFNFGLDTIAIHPSRLVQFAAKGRHRNLPSGLNLFIVCFLIDLDGWGEFELDWEQRDLLAATVEEEGGR